MYLILSINPAAIASLSQALSTQVPKSHTHLHHLTEEINHEIWIEQRSCLLSHTYLFLSDLVSYVGVTLSLSPLN